MYVWEAQRAVSAYLTCVLLKIAAPATGVSVFGGFPGSEPPVPAASVGRGRPGLAVGCRGCGDHEGCTDPSGQERWVSASSRPQELAQSCRSSSSVCLMSNKCIKPPASLSLPCVPHFYEALLGGGKGMMVVAAALPLHPLGPAAGNAATSIGPLRPATCSLWLPVGGGGVTLPWPPSTAGVWGKTLF